MSTHLPHLDVGSGRQRGALTLFPVWIDQPSVHGVVWKTDDLTVGELPGGASVSRLVVENLAPQPTLLLEGDLLVGGMQHRMAASSTLLPALESSPVDVLCVEHGRWSGDRAHRSTGRRASYTVRQGNLIDEERAGSAQQEVWSRVERYDRAFVASPTSSMLDHLDRVDDEPVRRMSGQRGVIVGIGGRVIGMELFGSSRGLTARWDGLVRAAQLDARMAAVRATPAQAARDFVRALGRTEFRDGERAGLATAVRSASGPLRVRGVRLPDAPLLHLTAFDDTHPLLAAA